MKKNKLLIGTLVSVLTIGLVTKGTSKIIKSQNGKTSIISTDAAEGTQLTFNQIEGGTWNPNISGSMYRYAVGFKETLTFSNSNAGSLFFTDEIEDAITVNGVSLKNVGGRLSNSLGNGWLFLELPTSLNQPSEQYGRPLVEFKNTKLFDKTYKLPNMKFYMEEDGALSHFIMDYLEIGWNNIDYNLWASSVATYSTGGIPNNGYILLLKGTNNGEEVYINDIMNQITDNYVVSSGTDFSYKSLIGSTTSNIASHITVNGVSINNIDGAILATQSARIWMFLPETVGVRPEVEILPGATLGRSGSGGKAMHYYVDPQIFRFDCFMGVNGYWSNVTAKKQIKDVNYSGIAWNGIAAQDYVDSEGNLEKGILLQFDQNLSSENFCVNCNDRMHNFLYGKYGSYIRFNGVNFEDVEGSELCYFGLGYVWLYTPAMKDAKAGDILEVDAGVVVDEGKLPYMAFKYNGDAYCKATKVTFDCKNGQLPITLYGYADISTWNEYNITVNPVKSYSKFLGWGQNNVLFDPSTTLTGFEMNVEALYQDKIASFTGLGTTWNNTNNGQSYVTAVFFNQTLDDGTSQTSSEHIIYEDWGKHVYLNDISFYDLATTCGYTYCNLWYYPVESLEDGMEGKNSILFGIDLNYFDLICKSSTPVFKIEGGTKYRDCIFDELKLSFINGKWTEYTPMVVETQEKVEIKAFDGNPMSGMSFETRIKKADYDNVVSSGSPYSLGTYLIVRNSFVNSGYSTISDYIKNVPSGSKSYVCLENTGKDFINMSTVSNDGYYSFKGSLVAIKEGNFLKEFIPVGYITIGGETYFGQKGNYYTSFYRALRANPSYPGVANKLNGIADIKSTSKSHLIEKTYHEDTNFTVETSSNGFYKLTAVGADISTVILDGVIYDLSIKSGSFKFVQNVNNKFNVQDKEQKILMGFAEPNVEQYMDGNTNTHASASYNSTIFSTFNGKCARIWITGENLLDSVFPQIGIITPTETHPKLNADKVESLKDTIRQYKAAGVEEITLMLNFFVYDYTITYYYSPDYNEFVSWYTWATNCNEGQKYYGKTMLNYPVIPDKDTEPDIYATFIRENTEFYKLIGEQLEGYVDCVEAMNEFNIGGQNYNKDYIKSGGMSDGGAQWLLDHDNVLDFMDFTTSATMDYCKAMSDGIKQANSSIKVLSPAIAPIGDSVFSGIRQHWDGKAFFDGCYKYMDTLGGNYNDFFQGINIHPYMFASKESVGENNDCYLYTETPHGAEGFDFKTSKRKYGLIGDYLLDESGINRDYAEDWSNFLDSYHNISESYGDYNKPMYFTEFGLTDYGGTTDSNWQNWNNNNFVSTVLRDIYSYIVQKSYIHSIYYFRMYDFAPAETTLAACGEPNFGVIEQDGSVKENAKTVYYMINGEEYSGDMTSLTLFPNW